MDSKFYTIGIYWDVLPDLMIFGCVGKWGTPTLYRDLVFFVANDDENNDELQGFHLDSTEI